MKRMIAGWMLVCAVSATSARADDASKRAKVQELFTVMHANQMSEQIAGAVRRQMEVSMRSLPGVAQSTPEQKKLLTDYESKVMGLVDQNVSWQVLEPQMVDLYSTTYSEQELDGILTFYKSPAGQAMLAKTPELTQKTMAITQGKLATLQPQISEISQNFVKQYSAAAPSAAPAAGSGAGAGASGASGATGAHGAATPKASPPK